MQTIDDKPPERAFQRIKDHIASRIRAGELKEGDVIPTELELARQFGVSRMTANRAVRELAAEQLVFRVQGAGTYVAQRKFDATLIQIKNIADEITARGHEHSCELHLLERVRSKSRLASDFKVAQGTELFHSIIVHFESGLPIQVEDRWVNPLVAPDYMQLDFSSTTPNAYLMKAAPLQGVEYTIEAMMAKAPIAELLRIDSLEPCLVLKRKTFSKDSVASIATLWHPGSRFRFFGAI